MTPELQRKYEKIETLSAMLLDLEEMYGAESRTRRLNLSRKLFKAQMPEGTSVHDHGLEMINMIEQLTQLGFVMDHDLTAEANLDSTKSKIPTQERKLGGSGSDAKNQIKQLVAEGACFQYGKTGHWKKDCRVTGAGVSSDVLHGASTSGIFMIELNLALNSSSSWVLDTGCGTNLCNSL
ncbi:zf-CCHC domain-containing protein/UBN2_2 domain-containing protein [Cephalotus follicularis]|uniref:Zf-CCHC domain-containing protein/UBN2_2 domain-containing protein n=1 Tax=Cephalotus follicularis TaxID=3775 RepID=A0A1Q3BS42_CEPFO|nr:zf-CCHC domain-containing protein/UBN2_2 domain-containing protein [Cephalotus follicularis]